MQNALTQKKPTPARAGRWGEVRHPTWVSELACVCAGAPSAVRCGRGRNLCKIHTTRGLLCVSVQNTRSRLAVCVCFAFIDDHGTTSRPATQLLRLPPFPSSELCARFKVARVWKRPKHARPPTPDPLLRRLQHRPQRTVLSPPILLPHSILCH